MKGSDFLFSTLGNFVKDLTNKLFNTRTQATTQTQVTTHLKRTDLGRLFIDELFDLTNRLSYRFNCTTKVYVRYLDEQDEYVDYESIDSVRIFLIREDAHFLVDGDISKKRVVIFKKKEFSNIHKMTLEEIFDLSIPGK